eukprot:5518486-Pleurochrysis_carterae.AAC.1
MAAERAEIANHEANGSWRMIDRSDVPHNRNLVRLIWVYKRKRSGSLKARRCVQGCSQIHGVDYEQTFCATMRATSLRALAALAARQCDSDPCIFTAERDMNGAPQKLVVG